MIRAIVKTVYKAFNISPRLGFSLAEVLLTIAIIGVVAAITISTLNNFVQDMHYKTAYKQAYSDANQAWRQAIANNEMIPVTSWYGGDLDLYNNNYNSFSSYFNKIKTCSTTSEGPSCWPLNSNDAEFGSVCRSTTAAEHSFIDTKGRSWVFVSYGTVSVFDGLCVDTNGLAKPNIFGKDRFFITSVTRDCDINSTPTTDKNSTSYGSYNQNCFVGLQEKLLPLNQDIENAVAGSFCPSGKCRYKSWLLN